MGSGPERNELRLGYLSIVEHADQGYFGGYLIVNAMVRPLEFHCTTPVKPSRAQQILYGASLEPFLFVDQIGQALVRKSSCSPHVVCVDRESALGMRDYVDVPVVLLRQPTKPVDGAPSNDATAGDRCSILHGQLPRPHGRLSRPSMILARPGDDHGVHSLLAGVPEHLDLLEPFDRIYSAIEEAQRYP